MTPAATGPDPRLSVILPLYNERENLPELHAELERVLGEMDRSWEILYVDDGSRDGSERILEDLAARCPRVRVIQFGTNYGQTAALSAGIDHARGEVLVTLDADLQNDPQDIPALVARLEEGYDVVSGWRKDRQDAALLRVIPSRLANALISRISGTVLHDFGCTLKAYRREVFSNFHLYGDMHRFIPAYAGLHGARVTEMVVRHHPRVHGTSKYGISRTFRVILDLVTFLFLKSYSTKPIHIFGGLALLSLLGGMLAGSFVMYRRWFLEGDWISPMILVCFFLTGQAIQLFVMGLIAEMVVRTYHESQGKAIYVIRRSLGGEADPAGPPPSP